MELQIPSSNPPYPINPPIEEPQPTIYYTSFVITSINVILNEKAEIKITLMGDVKCLDKYLVMEGEDYALWTNQDDYVYLWVCNQLGIPLPPK